MGYSITQKRADRLEQLRQEGRLCAMNNGRGGCANRATVLVSEQFFPYHLDQEKPQLLTTTLCTRHAMPVGFEGDNFRILSSQTY